MESTALKVVTWEDEFYELMSSVTSTYYDIIEYLAGNPDIAEAFEALAEKVYILKYPSGDTKQGVIPRIDDIFYSYEETIAEIISEAVDILFENNREAYMKDTNGDIDDAYTNCESEVWEQYVNSGSNDPACVYLALKSMGCNYLILPDNDSAEADLPPNTALSVGDAQNILFPEMTFETEIKFHMAIGTPQFDEAVSPGTVMAIRYMPNEVIGIGGEVKWN